MQFKYDLFCNKDNNIIKSEDDLIKWTNNHNKNNCIYNIKETLYDFEI